MAQAPLHQCSRCRKLVRGNCPHCAATPRTRTTPVDPFYRSTAWRKLRARFIASHPLCAHCEAAGRTTAATHVDHVLERRDRPDLELEWDNLAALCTSCHSRKTRIVAAKRRR